MHGRPLVLMSLAVALAAVDLPGVPGPAPAGPEALRVQWGNDALGPGMGGASDDFRTNSLSVAAWRGPWFAGLDHSILTTANPSGTPVQWGLPDPFAARKVGAARLDELTLTAGALGGVAQDAWRIWYQGGPGLRLSGDLGGASAQNDTHGLVGQSSNILPYEEQGVMLVGLLHGGGGLVWVSSGPLQIRAETMATLDQDGRFRWRMQGLVVATGAGGGIWGGLRDDRTDGGDPGVVQRTVDDHEAVTALVAGWTWQAAGWSLGLETARATSGGGQYGTATLGWVPGEASSSGTADWSGRFGVVSQDGAGAARGIAWTVARRLGDEAWSPWWQLGFHDLEIDTSWRWDVGVARQSGWTGLGWRPDIGRLGDCVVRGLGEVSAGWQHLVAESRGLMTVDRNNERRFDDPMARAACGVEAAVPAGSGSVGVFLLGEAVVAPRRKVLLTTIDPLSFTEVDRYEIAVGGTAVGVVLGLSAAWGW